MPGSGSSTIRYLLVSMEADMLARIYVECDPSFETMKSPSGR